MRIPGPSKEEGARGTLQTGPAPHTRVHDSKDQARSCRTRAQTDAHGGDERASENALQKLLTVTQLFGHIVLIL